MHDRMKALTWGIKLAWRINWTMLLGWTVLSVALAVLPAVALNYNRSILAALSSFLTTGVGQFSDVVPDIIILGVILTISGLSSRLSDDLLYMMMFDSYYLGLEEVMMESAQRIDSTELTKKQTGDDFFAAISRCGSLTDLTSSGCSLLAKFVSIVSLLAVAFTVSKLIFLITVIYIFLVLWLNHAFADKVRVVWKELREDLRRADYFEKLSRNGDTAKEVRIFGSAGQIKKDWEGAYHKVEKTELRRALGTSELSFLSGVGFYIFMAAIVAYSVFQVAGGGMSPAVLLMIYTLCISLAAAVSSVPASYQRIDYGLYGLDIQRRFFELTPAVDPEEEAKKADTPLDEETCFEAENLCFSYRDEIPVLNGLNFKIKKGETIALVGSNGSGKTTLVKLLLGLYRPTSGTIKFMGRRHEEYQKSFITQHIGAFFQDFYLFHLTLGENVGMGDVNNIDDKAMILKAIQNGGAETVLKKMKKGLSQILRRNVYKDGAELSGGESQRVAVSRAHMSAKPVLVFDEPASMLDPIAEMEQFFHIKQKLGGHTSILISHRIGFARLADRILVLDKGQIVEDGSHDELMMKDGIYANLFRQQAQWYDTTSTANGKEEEAFAKD